MSLSMKKFKSLPAAEFKVCITSADSGIDSDASPESSRNLTTEFTDIETQTIPHPSSFLLGENEPMKERMEGINKALNWIKDELIKMKLTDKKLAKHMITIRSQITERKIELEKRRDTGYDSDTDSVVTDDLKEKWKLITKEEAFPTNGVCFENNKRATWAI